MRTHTLLLPALITLSLSAQDELAGKLARIQGLAPDALRDLQARLALSEGPADAKAYHECLVAYGIVNQTRGKDPKGAEALLDRTLKALEPRKDPDSLALHAACLAQKMGFSPMSAMTLAPKASGLYESALKAAPANPRVLTLQGVHVLHTPSFFGGGAKSALPILAAAVKAADGEPVSNDPWAPRWGRVESRAWYAIALAQLGQAQEAGITLQQAKTLDAGHGLLKYAERVVAAKAKG